MNNAHARVCRGKVTSTVSWKVRNEWKGDERWMTRQYSDLFAESLGGEETGSPGKMVLTLPYV